MTYIADKTDTKMEILRRDVEREAGGGGEQIGVMGSALHLVIDQTKGRFLHYCYCF